MQKSYKINSASGRYEVQIGSGFSKESLEKFSKNIIIICDQIIYDNYKFLRNYKRIILLEANESSKDLANIPNIIKSILDFSLKREGEIIGIGGGIIQDITCFVASIYMRGVKWYYFPTTFLGMCDSCIGGKASINISSYKNIVGNFYPPEKIFIDSQFLDTLDQKQIDSGLCEAIKIAYAHWEVDTFSHICKIFDLQKEHYLSEIINLTIATKKSFIEIDEFDQKERQLLNFGHGFGHAIESCVSYEIPHGIAVGFGMLWELYFSEERLSLDLRENNRISRFKKLIGDILKDYPQYWELLEKINVENLYKKFVTDKKHKIDHFVCINFQKDGFLERRFFEKNEDFLNIFCSSFNALLKNKDA